MYFSKITFFLNIFSDGETKPQDFSSSDNNLSVSELKLQDGDQLIAVNKLQKYVFSVSKQHKCVSFAKKTVKVYACLFCH